jgi:hypothetical protein
MAAKYRPCTPLFLPPYSPELNAIERVWLYLRERFLSHRPWPTYDDILEACCAAWNALLAETDRVRSLCSFEWATVSSWVNFVPGLGDAEAGWPAGLG